MHTQNYRYQPREQVVQQHYQERGLQRGEERRAESPRGERQHQNKQ